jgi:hypothetical protein
VGHEAGGPDGRGAGVRHRVHVRAVPDQDFDDLESI